MPHIKLLNYIEGSEITLKCIKEAYLLRLPFRLRVGSFYKHTIDYNNKSFEIILNNPVDIPLKLSHSELVSKHGNIISQIGTDVIILVHNPTISDETLNKLNNDPLADPSTFRLGMDCIEAMEALNNFIVAYASATNTIFGGTPLRRLQTNPSMEMDDINLIWFQITILNHPETKITDDWLLKAFQTLPLRKPASIQMVNGDLWDFPIETLSKIDDALAIHKDSIYLELAFDANSDCLRGDPRSGLLLAVAAFESVHAALVKYEIENRLLQTKQGNLTNSEKTFSEEYLIRIGISNALQLTPILMLDITERPSNILIKNCMRAVSIRNEIMHALTNKQGKPKFRNRTSQELSDAYSSMVEMSDCYLLALNNRKKKI